MFDHLFDAEAQRKMECFFLQEIAPLGTTVGVECGHILTLDPGSVYVVTQGHIKQGIYTDGGHEVTFFRLSPGTILGEMSYFEGPFSAIASIGIDDHSVVSCVSRATVERELARSGELYRHFIHSIVRKYRIVMLKYINFVAHDAKGKVSSLLLQLLSIYGLDSERGGTIPYPYTHQEIANTIGISRITVTTVLAQLRREGLISTSDRLITVHDPKVLSAYFKPIW